MSEFVKKRELNEFSAQFIVSAYKLKVATKETHTD